MPHRSSSRAVPSAPSESITQEVAITSSICRGESNKSSITICVVRDDSLEKLKEACKYRKSFFLPWKTGLQMLFATVENLQRTIESARCDDRYRILNLLVSANIEHITFDVPSHFRQLKVLRCANDRDKGRLLLDGAATYKRTRLDEWQMRSHKNHELIIGHERGVRIHVTDFVRESPWRRSRDSFSASEQAEIHRRLDDLSKQTTWKDIKGTVAAIIGMAVGTVKLGVSLSGAAGGVYVKYSFGLHAFECGAAGAKITAVATAAGPAVVMGVAAAAAVYFIPWQSLLNWLQNSLSFIWERSCAIWQRFKSWVIGFFADQTQHGVNHVAYSRSAAS